MFGFGKKKKKQENQKPEKPAKKTRADKIVMGAILGVAIGSVISVSLMPKKKKKNKESEYVSPRAKKGFSLFGSKKKDSGAGISGNPKKIPTETE